MSQTPKISNSEDSWYIRQGFTPPERISHDLKVEDISKVVKSVNPTNWRAEGDRLIADTDVGPLVQKIPTTHIFIGTDENNLPKFKKIDIN